MSHAAKTSRQEQPMPEKTRLSIGSAIALGLLEGKLDAAPTTAYVMTYSQGKCSANCGFCPQARGSQSKAELLSRISWPHFSTEAVITALAKAAKDGIIKRVCIQTLNYPSAFSEVSAFVFALKRQVTVPVSVSCQPLNVANMWTLSEAGVDRIGIAVDAATEQIFSRVKGEAAGGPYKWQDEFTLLRAAIGVFGEGNVSTHLIVGLGETEKQAVGLLQMCLDIGVLPALFTFTPVAGTTLENNLPPKLESYRRMQLARYLLVHSLVRAEDIRFSAKGQILDFSLGKDILIHTVESGVPFQTTGCPDCNRPFYNEKPSGPIYNYPRSLTHKEINIITKELGLDK